MPITLKTNLEEYFEKNKEFYNSFKKDVTSIPIEQPSISSNFSSNPIEHRIPQEVIDTFPLITDIKETNIKINKSKLVGNYDKLVSELSIRNSPQIVDNFDNRNASGFTPFMIPLESKYKFNSSMFGPNDSVVNYIQDKNAKGFTKNINETQYNFNSSDLGPNKYTVNYFTDRNAKGFTRYQTPLESLYDFNSSILGPNNYTANYITDKNATGFTRNMQWLETLYNFNSSNLGPNNSTANYFTDRNASGFTRFMQWLDTKYNFNSSALGPNNETVDYIDNRNASGFTRWMQWLDTKYNFNSSALGPNNYTTNYFTDVNGKGFNRYTPWLESFYDFNSSRFGPNNETVNYILDTNAKGFTRNMGWLETQYNFESSLLGPNNDTANYFVNNNAVGFTRNMGETQYKFNSSNLGPNNYTTNYIEDTNASGFTRKMEETQYKFNSSLLGPNNFTTNYFEDNNSTGFTRNMIGTQYNFESSNIGFKNYIVNYIEDKNATGFTKHINETQYKYESSQLGPNNKNTSNFTRYVIETQLIGKQSNLDRDLIPTNYEPNRIFNESEKGILYKFYTTRNSPSPLDRMFDRYDIMKEAYNYDWIKQPYVVRGIQRAGNRKPQRWGGSSGNAIIDKINPFGFFDVKLANIERAAKWQVSSKGLLSILLQTSLQRMNPAVQTSDGKNDTVFGRPTWNYNPLSNIRGGTRHGYSLFGLKADGAYEDVVKEKEQNTGSDTTGAFNGVSQQKNRLVTLYDELFESPIVSKRINLRIFGEGTLLGRLANNAIETLAESAFPGITSQNRIITLSTLNGGPDSIFGIGPTTIRRFENTRDANVKGRVYYTHESQYASKENEGIQISDDKDPKNRYDLDERYPNQDYWNFVNSSKRQEIRDNNFQIPEESDVYDNTRQYASSINKNTISPTKNDDLLKNTPDDVRTDKTNNGKIDSEYQSEIEENKINEKLEDPYDIKNYATIAYGKLPERTTYSIMNDFRKDIIDNIESKSEKYKNFINDPDDYSMIDNSIHTKKIVPDFGKSKDLWELRKKQKAGEDTEFRWQENELIKFELGGIKLKALNLSFNESMSSSWDSFTVIGRADPLYMFNSFERSGSVSFILIVESRSELKQELNKLNRLYSLCTPFYGKDPNGLTNGRIPSLTIGNLIKGKPVIVDSVSFTYDDDYGWDIEEQVPRKISVSISFKFINNLGEHNGEFGYSHFSFKSIK